MILKTFKDKSNKKYLNKLISERHLNIDHSKINSLGVILNIDEIDNLEPFKQLANHIKIPQNKFKIIVFSANKNNKQYTCLPCFNPSHFGWKGQIKHTELKSFLNTKFDALISYYTNEQLELKLLTTLSKAQLKIGILQSDKRLNDLIIKTNSKTFNTFKAELYKYLTILNKI